MKLGIILPNFNLFYKAVANSALLYFSKQRHSSIDFNWETQISSYIYDQLTYHKRTKNIQWEKGSLSSKWSRENWTVIYKRMKLE